MELDTRRLMREIFEEFRKMDAFRTNFKSDFFKTFSLISANLYSIPESDELVEFLDGMAEEALSMANSIVEKDRTYPEYRQVMELKTYKALLDKHQISEGQATEIKQVKYNLNVLLLQYYPAIFEFSSFGYRLLDGNVKFFAYQLTNALCKQQGIINSPDRRMDD